MRVRAGGAGVDEQDLPRGVRVRVRADAHRRRREGHRAGQDLGQAPLPDTLRFSGSGGLRLF